MTGYMTRLRASYSLLLDKEYQFFFLFVKFKRSPYFLFLHLYIAIGPKNKYNIKRIVCPF